MRRLTAIVALALLAAPAFCAPRQTKTYTVSIGTSTAALHTASFQLNGYVEEIRVLPSSTATANVAVVVDANDSNFANRTLLSSNSVSAAAYWRPRTALNERYVVHQPDKLLVTVTNGGMRANTTWKFVVIYNDGE